MKEQLIKVLVVESFVVFLLSFVFARAGGLYVCGGGRKGRKGKLFFFF